MHIVRPTEYGAPVMEAVPAVGGTPFVWQTLFTQYRLAAHCVLLVQLAGQFAEVPLHTYGEQDGEPADPELSTVHVPSAPVTLHASQPPEHVALQHRPSTQRLDEH